MSKDVSDIKYSDSRSGLSPNSRLISLLDRYNGQHILEQRQMQPKCIVEHQDRVASMASIVAIEMGMSEEQEEAVFIAASLHDIGMQQFKMPGSLSNYNRSRLMDDFRLHTEVGAEITGCLTHPLPIDDFILQHHERLDGSGFPAKSKEILTESMLIAIVDLMDGIYALHAFDPDNALIHSCHEVDLMRHGLLDPKIIDVCISMAEKGELFSESKY